MKQNFLELKDGDALWVWDCTNANLREFKVIDVVKKYPKITKYEHRFGGVSAINEVDSTEDGPYMVCLSVQDDSDIHRYLISRGSFNEEAIEYADVEVRNNFKIIGTSKRSVKSLLDKMVTGNKNK